MRRWGAAIAVAALLLGPDAAVAANKEQQLLMAELRMLQQQQQQLQQMLGVLAESLKVVSGKLDEQTAADRKALADQRLLIEGMTDNVRILRERSDDTNVRLSSITQELEAIRQSMVQAQAQPLTAAPPGETPLVDPNAPAGTAPPTQASAPPAAPPNISPQRTYDSAYSDYTASHYDLAIEGFQTFLRFFPKHVNADDAQLNIGNALYNAGKYQDAITAYQRVISDYPGTESVPPAHYKMGLSYIALKQPDLARKAFETILEQFDASVPEYMLARQRLQPAK